MHAVSACLLFREFQTFNVQSSGPVPTQETVGFRICDNLDLTLHRKSDYVRVNGILILTSRNIICHPKHVRYNSYENKVVEVEFRCVPFRRLGNWSATVICPHTCPWNRVISLSIRSCIVGPAIDYCLVWCPRRTRKPCVNCVESVYAPDIGEDTHRVDI